jgi:peptidoglycan/LPS O-acetylase OafA/YrhL
LSAEALAKEDSPYTIHQMKLNSIQFLRAVAALLVVYQHSMDLQMSYAVSWQQNFYHLYNFGCIGVDLFFVISGFIITYVAYKYMGLSEGLLFIIKRFTRINLLYYIATLLFLGVYCLQLQANIIPIENAFNKTISSLIDALLIIPTSSDTKYFLPLLNIGWTLAFEWLFYIIFFSLVILKAKRKTLFLPGVILTLILLGQLINSSDLRMQFFTNPILLEFVLGMFICGIYLRIKNIPVWIGAICLTVGLITYMILIRFGFDKLWYYYGTITGELSINRLLLWGIPSSCIVAGCVFLERNNKIIRLFNNRLVELIGNASYSIYLIHYIIFGLFMLLYQKTGFFLPADALIWIQLLVAIVISIAFYKLLEKPLLQRIHHKHSRENFVFTKRPKFQL